MGARLEVRPQELGCDVQGDLTAKGKGRSNGELGWQAEERQGGRYDGAGRCKAGRARRRREAHRRGVRRWVCSDSVTCSILLDSEAKASAYLTARFPRAHSQL